MKCTAVTNNQTELCITLNILLWLRKPGGPINTHNVDGLLNKKVIGSVLDPFRHGSLAITPCAKIVS